MYLHITLLLPAFWSAVAAREYDFCSCQYDSNTQIYFAITDLIAEDCAQPYIYGQANNELWIPAPNGYGPRFSGRYLKLPNGKIDGTTFYNLCKSYGAGDSTCFDCGGFQWNPDRTVMCIG
ncbi:hypothetical protein ACJQWK_04228 [Exserohilum turcicum]|uniref:Uncharacterized protein n=2 Tax=Exserohilum turcicum TaxID=93612 RepID=R0J3M1_EXST2|nr:uncharacterized protein SETTUDRAFT_30080 [Exserohilum turcica Et28A]QIP67970.1 secreted in xylem 5 [Exserohilum turcicum]EOA91550.1 hypothetical protein SETTUDRAFT_30080 [Exserohilum turcica Et28A]QIP67971.1 secreted in xylem 5 [Exserohilum turcicum]QIP67972.1 secreted in xylem 5 [Exserohilum turcicum]QIP67973.1 secreted in xylem 5 [Exserohilum turcicum]